MGRPSVRTAEIENAMLEWVAEGRTLRDFCRQENTPAWRTIYDWLDSDAEFSARFARARSLGHDAIAEEALEIANTPMEGTITTEDEDGTSVRREDMLGHRKLQVETRLKLLAKWSPKKYGDKLELAGDAQSPLTVAIVKYADQAPQSLGPATLPAKALDGS